jgi:hypothetical protein
LRRALLRTAVTVTIAGLVGGALWWRTDDDRQLAASYRATLAIAHGRYLRAAPLLAEGTVPAGHMFAYEGKPSWILVIVRTRNVSGGFVVQLVTRNGLVLPLGSMTVRHGEGSWGSTISIPVDRIAAVTLSSPRSPAITGRLGS